MTNSAEKPTNLNLHCLLRLGMSCSARVGLTLWIPNRSYANSVDSDKTYHNRPSYLLAQKRAASSGSGSFVCIILLISLSETVGVFKSKTKEDSTSEKRYPIALRTKGVRVQHALCYNICKAVPILFFHCLKLQLQKVNNQIISWWSEMVSNQQPFSTAGKCLNATTPP